MIKSQNMNTPLIVAANTGNKEIVQLLTCYGAKLDSKNIVGDNTSHSHQLTQ